MSTWELPAGAARSWDNEALQLPTKYSYNHLHFWVCNFFTINSIKCSPPERYISSGDHPRKPQSREWLDEQLGN